MSERLSRGDGDAVDLAGADRRTLWGRVWRYWLGPPLYYFDCRGPDGKPAHAKVLSTIAFGLGIVWVGILLNQLVHLLWAATARGGAMPPAWLATLILAFSTLVFGMPYGIDGYKSFLKTRGGGTVDAMRAAVENAATGKGYDPDDEGLNGPDHG